MQLHVVVGAGPVGRATANLLAEQGHEVKLVTRSGGGPEHPGIERVALDASSSDALADAVEGAAVIYSCASPPYTRWAKDFSPLAASILAVAQHTDAVLVMMGNLYGYGPVTGPMTPDLPLVAETRKGRVRAASSAAAFAAHAAGAVRATEARASDFIGPAVRNSVGGARLVEPVLAGKPVGVLGDPDAPHSWTYADDAARTLVALGGDSRAWGRAWHVPTDAAVSSRELVKQLSALADGPAPKVRALPKPVLRAAALVSPMMRELAEIAYQYERPFVIDASATTSTFGIQPTPLVEALRATLAWWRGAEDG